MRTIIGLAVVVCTALARPAGGEDPRRGARLEVFSVNGAFSVDTPPNGFKWTEVSKSEAGDTKGRMYACTKKGAAARIALAVYPLAAKDDETRIATLKQNYNILAQSLKDSGVSDLKSAKPELEPPIKDRVVFKISGKVKGQQAQCYAITVFGQNTYLFQVFATSNEEAEQFAKITESLKEAKQESSEDGESKGSGN